MLTLFVSWARINSLTTRSSDSKTRCMIWIWSWTPLREKHRIAPFRSYGVGGRLISTLQKPGETKAARAGITGASFGTKPHAQELQHITELMSSNGSRSLSVMFSRSNDSRMPFARVKAGTCRGKSC